MSDIKLGTIPGPEASRDAIHAAIIPMQANCDLERGDWVFIKNGRAERTLSESEAIGIVDPFLERGGVERWGMFWLVLKPGTVTGIRHHWAHPKFPEEKPEPAKEAKDPAEVFLREFAAEVKLSFEELMEATKEYCATFSTIEKGDYQKYEWSMPDEFWEAYEKLTGTPADGRLGDTIFTCCPN